MKPISVFANEKFIIYDATHYKNKRVFEKVGIDQLKVIYAGEIYNTQNGGKVNKSLPSELHFRNVLNKHKKNSILVFDIEHWDVRGDNDEVANNIDKYVTITRWAKTTLPETKIGFYGVVPIRDYWRAISKGDKKLNWIQENNKVGKIAQEVDMFFPSLYTFYDDVSNWEKYAKENILEAKKYDKDKPVYIFIWPQYHESNKLLGGKYIPYEYWRVQLETAYKYADGIVLWGGWGEKGPVNLDEDLEWWQATKDFLKKINYNK